MPPNFGKCRICGSAEGARDWAGTDSRPVHLDPHVCIRVLVAEVERLTAELEKIYAIFRDPHDGPRVKVDVLAEYRRTLSYYESLLDEQEAAVAISRAEAAERRIAELEAELAALKAAGEWRPVTETDPPNGQWVQVGWPDGNISKAHRYDEDTWINTDGLKFQFVPGKNPMFRYLPTPPKGNQ